MKHALLLSVILTICLPAIAQRSFYPVPLSYVVGYSSSPPSIDGDIDEDAWQKAAWTTHFVDIQGEKLPKPYYQTRAKMLWDDSYLYIAAELKDEQIWAYLTQRDDIVYHDNDFEIFIDPSNTANQYFEIEINALNTIFDLFLSKPYRANSKPLFAWGSDKLKHAVKINGTLNNPADKDKSWTAEIAIPWSELSLGNDVHVPKDGEMWRLNFSRVQWETEIKDNKYVKKKNESGKDLPENNWVWSPQGEINMHMPERWGYIQFSKIPAGEKLPAFQLPYAEKQRRILWETYYAQQAYKNQHQQFARELNALKCDSTASIDGRTNQIELLATPVQFTATISDGINSSISINNEGWVEAHPRKTF